MDLLSTGLLWNEEKIINRYKMLKRVEGIIKFDLIYYPYWNLKINSVLSGKFLRDRAHFERIIVNGKTGKAYRILNEPEFNIIDSEEIKENSREKFHINKEKAIESGCELLNKYIEKKFNHPFRPRINMKVKNIEHEAVFKPFWVINNGNDFSVDKIMIVDATTGIAGVNESEVIINSWIKLRNTIQTRVS